MSRPPEKFRVRLKQLLGLKSNPNVGSSPQLPPPSEDLPVFSDELLKEIGKENSQASRARVLKELCEVVAAKRLEENAVEVLWLAVEDLLSPEVPTDVRHITFQFLTSLVTGQFDTLKLLRAHFFRVIQNHSIPEDLLHRLLFLKALTADGKEIGYFEEYIGPFLNSWMPDIISGEKLDTFLPLLRNIIRYHASYLDEEIIAGIVKQTCQMSNTTEKEIDVENGLAVLDTVVRYSSPPSAALYHFVVAVCNTVNIERFCQPSWKLMKHLLGTHLGHNGVLTMCYILEDSNNWKNFPLLRGTIFFVGMCLWGSKRVTTLKHKPITVLPSFYKVLSCGNESVICEVTLSMQRLVKKYGSYQHVVAWDTILDIAVALQEYLEKHPSCEAVSNNFHILVSYVEELYEKHQFNGSPDKLFNIVERCTSKRPESSVILLVSYRAQFLHPYYDNWFANMKDMMEKYFKNEERTQVRIKVLDALSNILKTFSHLFEDEILDYSVFLYLESIYKDQDIAVRIRGVQLLVDVIETSDSAKVTDILNVVEKVTKCSVDPLKRHVKSQHGQSNEQLKDDKALEDIKEAVLGLVRLFKVKLFRPAQGQAERIFNILVSHIKAHYDNGYRNFISAQIRLAILECLLSLRADSSHRLGIVQGEDQEIKFSSYFRCFEKKSSCDEKCGKTGLVAIPYSEAMNVILMCLQQEWEWQVLDIVLRNFPEALQDKNLILTGKQYLNSICSVLCKMVSNYDFLTGLCRVPRDMKRLHLYGRIFPVLTELSTYHTYIGQEQQFCLLQTMEIGLISGSAALCISCLTICMLEMSDVMASLLPTFLQCFVKLAPSPEIALPLLEFLSALSHLCDLYTHFTTDEFRCVFRICLPYTNSSRYSRYTVTLAHNVVASWYVHCPLLIRKQFVSFIVKNLKEPDMISTSPPAYLRLPISPNKRQPSPTFPQSTPESSSSDDSSGSLSVEMMEIMVDMMAKYTFSSSLTQPKRTTVVEQLLANGISRSWLLGNALVTVTVSRRSSSNLSCPFCSSISTVPTETKATTGKAENLPKNDLQEHEGKTQGTGTEKEPLDSSVDGSSIASTPAKDHGTGTMHDLSTDRDTSKDAKKKQNVSASQCNCVCQSWAEILIRRPTGNTSWILRLQNRPKHAGRFSSTQRLVDQKCPKVYESVIPKEFFDDLSADLEQKLATDALPSITLFSKSEDSDTLVVDLINPSSVKRDEELTDKTDINTMKDEQDESNVLETSENTSGTNESSSTNNEENEEDYKDVEKPKLATRVKFDESKNGRMSASSLTSVDYSGKLSLASSFMERTRLLSRSPMDGLSAFMVLDSPRTTKPIPRNLSELSGEDIEIQHEFEKPILGKSPLDASPLKFRLDHEKSGDEENIDETELDASLSMEDEEIDFSVELGKAKYDSSTPITGTKTPEIHTSLPGSRTQSPLSGVSRRVRLSESSGGSSSLPTSPAVSPKRRPRTPQLASGTPIKDPKPTRSVTPGANTRSGVDIPSKRSAREKSATVDIGMLRRISSSPDISEPIKEKRGLLKIFTADGEKARPVPLRRQTMSSSQLQNNAKKRRSYNGPFLDTTSSSRTKTVKDDSNDAMCPNFIFLQFYHSMGFDSEETPLAVPEEEFFHRAIKNLDRIPSYDTHKIGVIYVGRNQETDEVAILRNRFGSTRYMNFLSGLGELVRLRDCALSEVYTGGLDRNGADGEYAYNWRREIAQVIFHVATLMPNKDRDPNCHSKKLHIGNDFVTIVYNDSKSTYKMGTIKGQFNFVEIVIKPLDNETNVITINMKDELKDILTDTNRGPRVISDQNLATLVRHIALHLNMASVIHKSQKTPSDAYGCNWLQRLRQLKRIQGRVLPEIENQFDGCTGIRTKHSNDIHSIVDFTTYILQ